MLIVVASIVAASLNAFCLVALYGSIRESVEYDVKSAMADMDIDEMWERAILFNTRGLGHRTMNTYLNSNSDSLVSTMTDEKGSHHILDSKAIRHDISYTNQMVADVSRQMHGQIDYILAMNPAVTDSILRCRLHDRGIDVDFVAVELISHNDSVIVINPVLENNREGKDVFTLTYDYDRGLTYRAYLSPLTGHILGEMSGVIASTILLIVIFAAGFRYLFMTVGRLRSIEAMKDDFVGNMTHELKTPIAIAYSANDALLNHCAMSDPEKTRRYLTVAVEQLTRLSGLVENILSMSMERRKSIALSSEHIELLPFVRHLTGQFMLKADKECKIDIEAEPDDVAVMTDPTHLGNILTNLIDNALKYSGDSVAIKIIITHDSIRVADNGIGIPRVSLPHVFDKFYRVPHGNLHDVRGYGIGLYYVKSMTERMGWSIDVSSTEGVGTEFTIKFSSDR